MDITNIDIKNVISKQEPEPVDIESTVTKEKREFIRKWIYRFCVSAPIISILITTIVGILKL